MASSAALVQTLIEAHYESLYRYAYRLSGSVADAEDLTQETFGKALAHAHQLRDEATSRGWLFRILRNGYLHKVRDQKRHKTVPLDSIADVAGPGSDAPDLPVDPARLQVVLDGLDEAFRTPLILYYFEEFSYKDIAEQMGVPIGTVMSRLARAKAHLRDKLGHPDTNQPC